ncbi:STAS domain-containing protein [Kitasatospora brasiliensis]|uniref:STAS domain-containing protein n=1 Tax=Kitasatospora brasiliensis TaxID=3058040 RepID=UPI00293142B9|nr:STAS domain-containing protein [Kitasatospora sp. K002]
MPGPSEESREPGGLRVAVGDRGPVRVVSVAGELDHDTADGLRAALAPPPSRDGIKRIVVDLTDLWFCDSTGLNILLRARLDAQAVGLCLELAGPRPLVARLFAITGADDVLRVHPDLRTALAASEDGPGSPAAPPGRA